ncbi:MAG: hypothetical protein ACK40X_09615, partial [Armatimonadota bacterium]
YFKHCVYGLRFLLKSEGLPFDYLGLPSIKHEKKLPVVLSKEEVWAMLQNAKLVYAEKLPSQGNSKLLVRVQQGSKVLEMTGEGMSGLLNELQVGMTVHVCFTADIKLIGGIPALDLQIVDIAPANTQRVIFRNL